MVLKGHKRFSGAQLKVYETFREVVMRELE